jgi:hypothetical protein
MKIQSKETSWLLPIAMAVAGLLLLMAATAQGQGTGAGAGDLAQPEAYPLFWAEDFSAPLPPDTYYITATTGSGIVDSGSFLLTENAGDERGRIFYLAPTAMVELSATFHLYLGKYDGGADGAAFHFCPVYDYPPDVGSTLDALCPGGYLVAFDTYEEEDGLGPDRVYVAHETPSNRLASEDVDDLEDGLWHTATVLFQQPFITVTLDGSDVIAGAELPGYTPFLGYFGFSAATGEASNSQGVDDIRVYAPEAPTAVVDGYVTDAATGWPLYASVDTNSPAGVVWTDPGTGYYSISLPEGVPFDFHVEVWVPGYIPEDRVVGPLAGDTTESFALDADLDTCLAPGYQGDIIFFDDFEGGLGNWTTSGLWNQEQEGDTCGALVAPFPSSDTAAYYGQDGICTYDTGYGWGELTLVSPVTLPGNGGSLQFASYEETECGGDCGYDNRYVEISDDGGTTWVTLGEGDTEDTWYLKGFDLSAYGGDDVLIRFRFSTVDTMYNDFFGWMVDDVVVVTGCEPQPSGLVMGNVYDENTLDPLVGAKVVDDTGGWTYALATPGDPNVDDAFYTLFSPPGDHDFTASYMPPYGTDDATVTVVDGGTVGQDFFLPAPHLVLDPEELEVWVLTGTAVYSHVTGLDIINDGGLPLEFEMQEIDSGDGVAWFWEDPISGTVPANDVQNVAIGFTALYTDLTPMPLGDYTATLEVRSNDPVSDTQHVPVIMHIVEEFTAPIASFESNSPVCEEATAVFTNTTIPGVPPQNAPEAEIEAATTTTYTWDFGDGETSTEFEPTHDYAAAGTYNVSLEACNPAGMCDTYEDTVEVIRCYYYSYYLPLIQKNYE